MLFIVLEVLVGQYSARIFMHGVENKILQCFPDTEMHGSDFSMRKE